VDGASLKGTTNKKGLERGKLWRRAGWMEGDREVSFGARQGKKKK